MSQGLSSIRRQPARVASFDGVVEMIYPAPGGQIPMLSLPSRKTWLSGRLVPTSSSTSRRRTSRTSRRARSGAAHAAYTSGGGAWVPRHPAGQRWKARRCPCLSSLVRGVAARGGEHFPQSRFRLRLLGAGGCVLGAGGPAESAWLASPRSPWACRGGAAGVPRRSRSLPRSGWCSCVRRRDAAFKGSDENPLKLRAHVLPQ